MEEILRNSGARVWGHNAAIYGSGHQKFKLQNFNPCPLTIWETLTVDQEEGISGNFQISLC